MKRLYLWVLSLVVFLGLSFGFVLPKLMSAESDLTLVVALVYLGLVVPMVTANIVVRIVTIVKGLLK